MSIRRGEQCKKAALKTKRVRAFHGGKSTGPRTKTGKARLVQALTVHGGETRALRREHNEAVAYLRELEYVAWALGMMTGTRTRGPKPKNYRPVSTLEAAKRWIAIDALGLRRKNKLGVDAERKLTSWGSLWHPNNMSQIVAINDFNVGDRF